MEKFKITFRELKYTIILVLFIALFLLVYNDYPLYEETICKVTNVEESFSKSKLNIEGYEENYYEQNIIATIKNGEKEGRTVHLKNTYAESQVYDEKYSDGDVLFIENLKENQGKIQGTITGVKRDYIMAAIFLLILFLILLIGKTRGKFIIISLIINIAILTFALKLSSTGINFLWLSIPFILIMSTLLLLMTYGFKKESIASITATLLTVTVIGLLSLIVMKFSGRIDYEFMEHLIQPYYQRDANLLFIAEIIIGGLGAIMDIAVTMTSTVKELIEQKPEITKDELIASTRAIGDDVMGTMVNVIFFTNIAGAIPFSILAMRNGIPLLTTLKHHAFFEIVRFLTGSIGLILAIPISAIISILILRREKKS